MEMKIERLIGTHTKSNKERGWRERLKREERSRDLSKVKKEDTVSFAYKEFSMWKRQRQYKTKAQLFN